jgi:quercetin dioxygenase-like cupin family protein
MTIKQILSRITAEKTPLPPHKDVVLYNSRHKYFTFYPDKSRSFDDIIMIIGMITSENSSLLSVLGSYLIHKEKGIAKIFFEDGMINPVHTHNFVELGYVAKGQFHKQIAGQDYWFNQGDIFLINKGTAHTEYIYRKNAAVFLLGISNTFFDKSMRHDIYDRTAEDFLQRFVFNGENKYQFIRFVPKKSKLKIPKLFEKILGELWQPQPGTTHFIIGYVERILNLLPAEFEIVVQWNNLRGGGGGGVAFFVVMHYKVKN